MDLVTLAKAKKYTDDSIEGTSGVLKGKNCTIKSIEKIDGVNTVTFQWTADDGSVKTSTMQVSDGIDGVGTDGKSAYELACEYGFVGTEEDFINALIGVEDAIESVPIIKNFFKTNATRMVAHRGVSAIAPECTLPAYELTGDFGYWGAEVDIQKTKDGYFVCIHDGTIDRTTNGTGNVSDMTLAEIQELFIKAQSYFMGNTSDKTLSKGEAVIKVPTLEEYLEVCKNKCIVPVIELKEETLTANDMPSLLEIIDKWQMTEQVVFIAFNDFDTNLLEALHNLNPKVHCQPIINFTIENIDYVANNFSPNCGIDPNYQQITKELVDYAHSKGVEVNCWTVDDETVKEQLMSYGVDYITTNKLVNPNLPEMKIGALDYELGGFERTVDAFQTLFKLQSELSNNKIYCQNPVVGNHNLYTTDKTTITNAGTTPYSRAILTNETVKTSLDRAIDKTKYYVKEKTVYVGGGDFSTYKITLVPFNEKGLVIGDMGWLTSNCYVSLPNDTTFVLFYFARVDAGNITEADLQAMKSFYFCKKQNRQFIKLDNFVFANGLSATTGNPTLNEMVAANISDIPTNRGYCLKAINTKDFSKCKIHYANENYKVTVYGFAVGTLNRLKLTKDVGWLEDDTEITFDEETERIYFAFKKSDDSVISYTDLIEVSNSIMVEIY